MDTSLCSPSGAFSMQLPEHGGGSIRPFAGETSSRLGECVRGSIAANSAPIMLPR